MQVPVVQAEINGSSSSRRVVLTFSQYDACQQWDSHENDLLCARMSKCYGRRLVLDVHVCYSGNLTDFSLTGIFGIFMRKGDLLSVEEDGMVVAGSLGEEVDGALVVGEEFNNDDEKVNAAIATGTYGPSTWDVLGANTMFENPLFLEQWNLEMLNISSYNISEVNGKGHVVAVLDSGVAATAAPAFKWLLNGYDFISDPEIALDGDGRDQNSFDPGDRKEGECETSSWHGTYVSSILGARIQKDAFRGIAEESMILPVRVLGKCNMGYASDVADAIAWSIGANITGMEINRLYTAKTILMSFTGKGKCPSYLQTVVSLAVSLNVTLYAAAGNDPSASAQDHFPANCEGVISVGAVDRYGNPTQYTSSNADMYMPGGTLSDPVPCLGPNLKVAGCTGTSMAVPHAGGLRALEMTDVDWVDPATLPIPLTPEQLALNYLIHSTYETVVKGANAGSCLSPSVLYADGFCGMRMNTSSDLRTIWQMGYPVVELQPGTYTDTAKHCNLAASVNAAINFRTTYLFSTSAGSVMITCGVPFTVNANFKLYIENITLNTGSGGNEIYCSGTSALLGLTNVRIQGYEGRAHFTNNALTIQNGCGLVTRGSLTFGLKSTSLGQTANSLLRFINPSTATSDIGGDMILFDQATSTWGILVTFTAKQVNAWVWNVSDIFVNGGGGAQPWEASSNLRHLFERCNIIIKKYRTTGPGPIHMTDATLVITEEFHRQNSVSSLWSWGNIGMGSLLTFNSSISRMVVQGAFNRLTINGRVEIKCSNVVVSRITQTAFLLQIGGYLEWSGSHSVFEDNTLGVFSISDSSTLDLAAENLTFSRNRNVFQLSSGRLTMVLNNSFFQSNIAVNGSVFVLTGGSGLSNISILNSTFTDNVASGSGGVIYGGFPTAIQNSSYVSFSKCLFVRNTATGRGAVIFSEKISPNITFTNCSFVDNCASSSSSRHAISMGYFPAQDVKSLSQLSILGTSTSFSRTQGKDSSNCPFIRASFQAYIEDLQLDSSDIIIPNSICPSTGGLCIFKNFYSGLYDSETTIVPLNPSISLSSRVSNPWDLSGRVQDSVIYILQPGVYTNGACQLAFTANGQFVNVTIMGNTTNPNDTVINCSASTFFATVGAGFTLNLDNLYIIRGTATNTPAISVAGTLFMENVTIGGFGGLMSVSAYANGGILNPTVITGTSFSQYSFVTTGVINSITFTEDTLVDILIIGGGGSGASRYGGGGGAGSLIYLQSYTMAAGTYSVNVGAGGVSVTASAGSWGLNGNSGGDSYIARNGVDILRAKGGGGGASCLSAVGCSAGLQGGSSGGSSAYISSTSMHPTIFNVPGGVYGNNGGSGSNPNLFSNATASFSGGGGGGAGSMGGSATVLGSSTAGSGGGAITLSIIGTERAYAGGGGGGCSSDATGAGAGGSSLVGGVSTVVGGAGTKGAVAATAGSVNTGSGGGGSGFTGTTNAASGTGGSGIVIVRFSSIQIQKNVFSIPTVISGTAFSHHSFNFPMVQYEVTFLTDMVVDVLVVGGGGSGGSRHAGGGGAGALIYIQGYTFAAGKYIVYVGNGGSSVTGSSGVVANGNDGGDTYIMNSANGQYIFLARGGGAGLAAGCATCTGPGGDSGGSTCAAKSNIPDGSAYGFCAGKGVQSNACCCVCSTSCVGGGGGGSASAGSTSTQTCSGTAGLGGNALVINITGVQRCFAAGGGGGASFDAVAAGVGGFCTANGAASYVGGSGSKGSVAAGPGAENTGSGGGGAGHNVLVNGASGAGGSGTVIIRFASSLSSSIRVSSTRALTTACSNTGLVCAGTTASCTLSGTNTFESITACMAANGGAIRAHTSASLLVQGNLTLRNIASAYAIRMEIGAGNVVFKLQNFVVQETYGGLLNILNGAGGSGMVNFSVADSTLVQGNLGNAHLFISDGIVSTQGVSISFGGRRAVISDNQITGHIFFVGHPAAHALGLPQISLTSSQQVDISHNLIGNQLARLFSFAYMLVECPEANITFSNNTLTTVSRHLIEVTATSSRVVWMCRNLTMINNQLTDAYSHIFIAMGANMQSSFNVTDWLRVQPRVISGVYPHFLAVSGNTLSTTFVSVLNNVYFSGLQRCISLGPDSVSASMQVFIQGLFTITNNNKNWALTAVQSNAAGPRPFISISGNYTFAGNFYGMVNSVGNSDIIFQPSSSGVVENNTVSDAVNYFHITSSTGTLQMNGIDLVVRNNTHHATTATSIFYFGINLNTLAKASCFFFTGLVYAETTFVPATVSFVYVIGGAGNFTLGGNHFISRGFNNYVVYVQLSASAILNSWSRFAGYFEISNRPVAAVPAIYITQQLFSGYPSISLSGFYNFTGNVAVSNPIMNLASANILVHLTGLGGIFKNNRATGTGTQVLINVASGSTLLFSKTDTVVVDYGIPASRFATHVFSNNSATFMTTSLANTVTFHHNGSTTCTELQSNQLSSTTTSGSVCTAPTPAPTPPPTPSPTAQPTPQPTPSPQCQTGTYLSSVTNICTECPAGTYSSQQGSTTCYPCTGGSFSETSGSSSCSMCPVGKAASV